MSKRSATETVVFLLHSFLEKRTWSQDELARQLGIGARAVRRNLDELIRAGVPLEREEDPPKVWWSVPHSWFPGGAFVSSNDVQLLLRLLCRLPRTAARDALVRRLVHGATGKTAEAAKRLSSSVVPGARSAEDEAHLALLEDATVGKLSVRMRYVSAGRGTLEWRHVSPARVHLGPPARFVGVCHVADALRWFRVDAIVNASADTGTPFRERPSTEVDAFLAASVDGFHDRGEAVMCTFVVQGPDARWVAKNLLEGMSAEPIADGVRVTARTSGVRRVASFVVGLGSAARPETPELRAACEELARGALAAAGGEPSAPASWQLMNKTDRKLPPGSIEEP